jgi:penicillin G amidase
MKKQQVRFTSVVALCLLAVLLPLHRASAQQSSTAAESKEPALRLAGLHSTVAIRRDGRGVPYITAANDEDLYFGQGYVVASDRLWEMDLLRRTGRGELSEILGPTTLEEDKRRRAYGYAALAEQMLSRLSPPARAALESYARGVNAFIGSLDKNGLPVEFRLLRYEPRPWGPTDSLVIAKVLGESLTTTWKTDLLRAAMADLPGDRRDELLPSLSPLDVLMVGSDKGSNKPETLIPPTRLPQNRTKTIEMLGGASDAINVMRRSLERVGLYAEDLAASNNWVVNGERSVTGKPLLANDPHLVPSAPSMWYMLQLTAPGLHVAGVTIPGVPGVFIGHNDHVAWGSTNVAADVQDLYIEKFDEANPRRYKTPAGWAEAGVRREEIKVRKTLTDPAGEIVEYNVMTTRHGPIILEKDGLRYALAWPALDPTTNEFDVYYFINRARSWKGFRDALSRYTGFPLNFVYADVEGHIAYWAAGRYPIRRTGRGTVPYDGSTGEGDWSGYVPFESTPHLYDPPSGVIVTANNRVVGLDYPYHITDEWAPPYRARRIYNLLTSKARLSVEDLRAIQADTYSFPDAIFVAEVLKLARPLAASSPEWEEIVAAFAGWDAMMGRESRMMPLSVFMRASLQRRILTAALGEGLMRTYSWSSVGTLLDRIITTRPREWLPKEFDSYEALILTCYKDALDTMTKRLGPDRSQWTWGRLMQVRFPHALANEPLVGAHFAIAAIPQSGGTQAVNRGPFVSMRYIADVSNWDNTRQGITLGQSGNPTSPHWKDQLGDWQAATPGVFPFSSKAVADATKGILIIAGPKPNDGRKRPDGR